MDSTDDKPMTKWRALWKLLGAVLELLSALMPYALTALAIVAFFRGAYESMHELIVVALLLIVGLQVGMVLKVVARLEAAQARDTARLARENLSTLDLLRRTLEHR